MSIRSPRAQRLHWDPDTVALSELLAQLASLGYTPLPYTEDAGDRATVVERRAALKRLIIAGLGMMQVMSFAVALYAGAWRDAEIQEFPAPDQPGRRHTGRVLRGRAVSSVARGSACARVDWAWTYR